MPALTTATRLPWIACSRRESTSGQRSSPFMVEAVPSVIESPKATIATRLGRRHHVDRVKEEPGCGAEGKRSLVLRAACDPAPGARDVGGLQRLGVPGHRPAFAGDMEADSELAARQSGVRVAHEAQGDGIAPDRAPGATVTLVLPPKVTGRLVALTTAAPAELQADEDAVEGHRPGAKYIGQAQARLSAPDVGLHDQAEGLVACAGFGGGKANFWSGWAEGLPTGYGPCAEPVQLTTQFSPSRRMRPAAMRPAATLRQRPVSECMVSPKPCEFGEATLQSTRLEIVKPKI